MFRRAFISTVVVLTAACAPSATTRLTPPPSALGRRDLVQFDELRRHHDTSSLLDVLARIRPQMLRPRFGATGERGSAGTIDVFIDGHFLGGAEVLRQVMPSDVASVRMVQRSQGYATHGRQLRSEHALFVTLLR
jgi:hypothetical protein